MMLFLSHLSLYRLVVRPIIGHSKWATAKKNGICLFFNPLQFSFEGGVVTISSLRKFPIITVPYYLLHSIIRDTTKYTTNLFYRKGCKQRSNGQRCWRNSPFVLPLCIPRWQMANICMWTVFCSGLSTLCVKDSSKKRRENPFFVTQI